VRYNREKELQLNFKKTFPSFRQLLPVYAVTVVVIYAWSTLSFFWRLPSFLYNFTAGEIVVTYAYLTVVNFLESIFIFLVPIGLGFLLPNKWFYDRFVSKGVLLVSFILGYLAYVARHINPDLPFPYALAKLAPLVMLVSLVLVFVLDQISLVSRSVEALSDRFIVFLYLTTPITVLALLIVIVRNIL
jgi:hypothetical protein